MQRPGIFEALDTASRVLIAGAGGGFDVYAGLPLAFSLTAGGKQVFLANLSFSEVHLLDLDVWLARDVAVIGPDTTGLDDYFPERALATWLAGRELPPVVYAFPKVGVTPLRAAYRELVEHLRADAIVLVDGGTDILMRGDESGLGTPVEDMTSLAAVAGLADVPVRLIACLGFGIDAHHGVNHVQVLENIADLDRDGAYLGAFSIPGRSREAALYRNAVAHSQRATPLRPSIVNGQIAAALSGQRGDVHVTRRTTGSKLFVNPLMAMYFTFDLAGVARHNHYLDRGREHCRHGPGDVAHRAVPLRGHDEDPARVPPLGGAMRAVALARPRPGAQSGRRPRDGQLRVAARLRRARLSAPPATRAAGRAPSRGTARARASR